jgi:hypothetical protein
MNRHLTSGLVVSACALFACVTEPCGCTPAVTRLVVVGTVSQADETPVAGAAVVVGEQSTSCQPSDDFFIVGEATTDAAGVFLAELLSGLGPGERCVIVRAASGNDTAMVERVAEFRLEGEPDTLTVAVTLGGE